MSAVQFRYSQGGLPFLPVSLISGTRSVNVSALVDSGSAVSVLPYNVGIELGLDWESQKFSLPALTGMLRNLPAFGVLIKGQIDPFHPVSLAFAWTRSSDIPVILGQTNFFSEFDVYFFGSQKVFSIAPKQEYGQ
jgi:hypothetical protein